MILGGIRNFERQPYFSGDCEMHELFQTESDILKPDGLKDFASAVAGLQTKT